ncbi:MAG: ATP-binding protein [Cyclobacteriaceae bacterium]|nr:ATP-binding protein [Cyclobacteriaceae bacterium]
MKAFHQDNSAGPKIVTVVGPECTGKTDLSTFLAAHFQTVWVPEYARAYLNKLNHPYDVADLTKIAHGQVRLEEEWMSDARRVLICDTNLLVIKIWSEAKYGSCDPEILRLHQSRRYDLLLLTHTDVPWENDPQREHPDKREHFMGLYRDEVYASGVPVVEISGDRAARQAKAIDAIQKLLDRP